MYFLTHQNNSLLWLSSSLLDGQPVRHGFSTRLGGVSPAPWDSLNLGISRGDSDENVWENYRRFCAAVGVAPESTVFTQQTHSENIRQDTGQDAGKGLLHPRNYTDVDALITDCPGLSLVVFSADCGTILLFDPVHRAIGAVHAGWRGTAKRIGEKTVDKMVADYGCKRENIIAAIGPCIGKCCYEVDDPVADALKNIPYLDTDKVLFKKENNKYMLDLAATNKQILLHAGIKESNLDITDLCTCCNGDELHSHRATHGERGNLAMIIELK